MLSLETLEDRLRILLPPEYRDVEDVPSTSMGSAGLLYAADGRVAWNEIWKSFCDLAMAGGPPHKGTLLQPASPAEITANQGRYGQVVEEICRGITLVTGLEAAPSRIVGWVRVECRNATMAGWLLRAIVMENVSARTEGATLFLPAGPAYRVEKEIKNVVTVIAKTNHYWEGHTTIEQQRSITDVLVEMEAEFPLVQMTAEWQLIECGSIPAAIRMMRLLCAGNLLSRREGATVFVPQGERITKRIAEIEAIANTESSVDTGAEGFNAMRSEEYPSG